jgi:hypothetical protein
MLNRGIDASTVFVNDKVGRAEAKSSVELQKNLADNREETRQNRRDLATTPSEN